MVASLDGFIARTDGRVDWLDTPDEFPDGESLDNRGPHGVPFFEKLDTDIPLHLAELKAYKNGMIALRYEVRGNSSRPRG